MTLYTWRKAMIEDVCLTFMVAATIALLCLDTILIHNIVKVAAEYLRTLETAPEPQPETQIDSQTTQKGDVKDATYPTAPGV
jgi:hypothetical protein